MPTQTHASTLGKCANVSPQQVVEHTNPLCCSKYLFSNMCEHYGEAIGNALKEQCVTNSSILLVILHMLLLDTFLTMLPNGEQDKVQLNLDRLVAQV